HAAEGTSVPGTANTLRLIVRLPGTPPIELYEARFPPRSKRAAGAHGPGTREHVLVTQGALRTGPVDRTADLRAGDYAGFAGDEAQALGQQRHHEAPGVLGPAADRDRAHRVPGEAVLAAQARWEHADRDLVGKPEDRAHAQRDRRAHDDLHGEVARLLGHVQVLALDHVEDVGLEVVPCRRHVGRAQAELPADEAVVGPQRLAL